MNTAAIETMNGASLIRAGEETDNKCTPDEKLTLAMVRERGISGADITHDQMSGLREEMYSKMEATGALEKDFAALKDKYTRAHNGTGISPENRNFRPIWDYRSREIIREYVYGSRREKLLALWDEREKCRVEDQYTRYLDEMIKAAGDLCTEDLVLYNSISAEYDKAFMERWEAKQKARKAKKASAGKEGN